MPFTPRLVLVTAPSIEQARALATLLVEKRLAACANLIPGVESHYRWEGKLESAQEVLLLIKSSAEQFDALCEQVGLHHPYAVPEIVAVSPQEIAPAYRRWWEESCGVE